MKNIKIYPLYAILIICSLYCVVNAGTFAINGPYVKSKNGSPVFPNTFYFNQDVRFNVLNNGYPNFGNLKWCLKYALSNTVEGLSNSSWTRYEQLKPTTDEINLWLSSTMCTSDIMYFKFAVSLTDENGNEIEFKVLSNGIQRFERANLFSNLNVSANSSIHLSEEVKFKWDINDIPVGARLLNYSLCYAIGDQTLNISNAINWTPQCVFSSGSKLNAFSGSIIHCDDIEKFRDKYILFKIKTWYAKEIYSGLYKADATRWSLPYNGYQWVQNHERQKLLERFKDFKVYLDIKERPYYKLNNNSSKIELSDEEIYSGVKFGIYSLASILPDMNCRFVNSDANADLIIHFEQCFDGGKPCGGKSLLDWDGTNKGEIIIDPDNVVFHKLDFVSPYMAFQYTSELRDPNKKIWGYYEEIEGSAPKEIKMNQTYEAAKTIMRLTGLDPKYICANYGEVDWNVIPYSDVIGTNPTYSDLVAVMTHELEHAIGLTHMDREYNENDFGNLCAPITVKPSQVGNLRWPTYKENIEIYIPRITIRQNKMAGISDVTSPSVMLGNTFGGSSKLNLRGIFDIDADALSTGNISNCECSEFTKTWRGYNVSYPQIRSGWNIVLQHRATNEKFYTKNWHIAHQKMGWVLNNNTRAIDTDWFVVDIIDSKGLEPITIGPFINDADVVTDVNSTTLTLKGTGSIENDNLVFASEQKKNGIIADVRLEHASFCGGIMIRQSLTQNSPVVYLCKYNSNFAAAYYRGTQGAPGQWLTTTFPSTILPVCLRLVRFGNTIKALISSDGTNFTEVTKVTFPAGDIYVGLSADGGAGASATFSNYKVRPYDPLTPIVNLLLND